MEPVESDTALTLVLLAAGHGRRFGGPKQLAPVGPADEPLLVMTVRQALRAGFGHFIVVTRTDLRDRLAEAWAEHLAGTPVEFVLQDTAEPVRERPWGTAHAVGLCAPLLTGPFAVANADDHYGDPSFEVLAEALAEADDHTGVLVSFPLANVLSSHGRVSRGVVSVTGDGLVKAVAETTGLRRTPNGTIVDAEGLEYPEDTPISMNLWGLPPFVAAALADGFQQFLATWGDDPERELYLPNEVSRLMHEGRLVLLDVPSSGRWVGITHPEDLDAVRSTLAGTP